jgi:hypothetical protein
MFKYDILFSSGVGRVRSRVLVIVGIFSIKRRFYSGVPRLVVFLYLLSERLLLRQTLRYRQRGEPPNKNDAE